tara:strand:+ start:183 stop:380 length:198 start_codon:yes stop_codon:yes gene_type:complete
MTDKELINKALNYLANHMETGNITLSRDEAAEYHLYNIIKDLDNEEMEAVRRLRKLAILVYQGIP